MVTKVVLGSGSRQKLRSARSTGIIGVNIRDDQPLRASVSHLIPVGEVVWLTMVIVDFLNGWRDLRLNWDRQTKKPESATLPVVSRNFFVLGFLRSPCSDGAMDKVIQCFHRPLW